MLKLDKWGIDVENVEDSELSSCQAMKRAMA